MSAKVSKQHCEICCRCCSNKSFLNKAFKTCGLLTSGANPKLVQNSRIVWVGNQHALCSGMARVQVEHSALDIPVPSQGLSELFSILFLVKPNCQSPNLSECWRGPAFLDFHSGLVARSSECLGDCVHQWMDQLDSLLRPCGGAQDVTRHAKGVALFNHIQACIIAMALSCYQGELHRPLAHSF